MSRHRLSFVERFTYAWTYIAVRNALIKGQIDLAAEQTGRLLTLHRTNGPSKANPADLNILYGLVCWNSRQFPDTYLACRIALEQIDKYLTGNLSGRQANNLKYLRGYCKNLIAFTDHEAGIKNHHAFMGVEDLKAPDYNLGEVSPLLKRTFPIDDTDWWSR